MTQFDLDTFLPYNMHVATEKLIASLYPVYKKYGIDIPQWRILAHLNNTQGFMPACDIRNRSILDKVTFTRATIKLEKLGWVSQQVNKNDRRHKDIILTDTGRAISVKIIADVQVWNQKIINDIGQHTIDTLIHASHIIQNKV